MLEGRNDIRKLTRRELLRSLAGSAALGGSAAAFFFSRSELIVFALAGVVGVTSTIFRPALQATLPSLARTPEELIAANGATSTLESLGTLLGPLVAGVLVSVANAGVVFLVASGALLVAALAVPLIAAHRFLERGHAT